MLIEHDMDLVFRFAKKISVLVAVRVLVEGAPKEIADYPRERRSISGGRRMAELLRVEASRPATARRRARGRSLCATTTGVHSALLGRNGVGKTTLIAALMGATRMTRGKILFGGRDVSKLTSLQPGALRAWLGAAGARHFRLALG